jgi:hypothetical protein
MRTFPAIAAGLLPVVLGADFADANMISRTARSGQPTRIAAYHSWDPASCVSLAATMNVTTKPAHGVLTARIVPHTITTSRFGTVRNCAGKPIKALAIEYRSTPGFRGADSFMIDVVFGWQGRRDTDNYLITVE